MATIWDDRLAEVWAEPGQAGAGVVVGSTAVLTARHVVAGALDGGKVLSRVVRPGATTASWVPMAVRAEDPEWDVALLDVDRGNVDGPAQWLEPPSFSPVFVRPGTSAEHDCEAVGFPQAEVQHTPDGNLVTAVRQSEQALGTLLPSGQAKRPVNPERPLPKRWMPFDVEGSTPGTQAGWGGMSGAGVILRDGRLVGLVVAAESDHQQRRLYMVPLADVFAQSESIAGALAGLLDGPAVVEVRDAPLYRDVLRNGCLAEDGMPVLVGHATYRAFGVKPAGVPGEPPFLNYVPRDADEKLRNSLQAAQAGHRMLLVVGGSAGGKSRSAAEAARQCLPGYKLLCPQEMMLARLRELPIADLGPVLVWLDDAEHYETLAFRDSVEGLLRAGATVVATIRRSELEKRMPKGDLRDPLGDALKDSEMVVEVSWPVVWDDEERARVDEHVRYPALLAWVAAGKSPSAWVVAGPALVDRLHDAQADDERPVRYAVIRTVLDWYRTGITEPMPAATLTRTLDAYLPYQAEPAEIGEALQWAFESVTGSGRLTSQSLLAKTSTGEAITVHDYIQDADARTSERPVADVVWIAALSELEDVTSHSPRYAVGFAAAKQGNTSMAWIAWHPLALMHNIGAMNGLGVLLADTEPDQSRRWYEEAAEAGDVTAMTNLGAMIKNSDPDRARYWYEKAAATGHVAAMFNLGNLLTDRDPGQACVWYTKAATAGDCDAMFNLALLLHNSDLAQARHWLEKAAEAGQRDAMNLLGQMLASTDPDQSRHWLEKAAEAGQLDAMSLLGMALADRDPDQARPLLEQAATAGDPVAMYNLWCLLADTEPDHARGWLERAAVGGHPFAMNDLGLLIEHSDPAQSRHWLEKAAEAGQPVAMYNLGVVLEETGHPGDARSWYEKAAEAGHLDAMNNLGLLLAASDWAKARQWLEKAAEAGHLGAMNNLGLLLAANDPTLARRWFEKAAAAGHPYAMRNLERALKDGEPGDA